MIRPNKLNQEDGAMRRSAVVALLVLGLSATLSTNVAAIGIQLVVILGNLEPNAPPLSLTVGVAEPGKGFGFVTFIDNNNDGIIQLPLVPVGSRLALGGDFGDGEEVCDIYVLVGSGVWGGSAMIGREIFVPLLTNAAPGGAVGIDFVGEVMAPPLPLTPGDRFTVMDGVLPEWPALRFVDVSGVPDLETFVPVVDTLPAFNGDVIVSNARLQFTFVPEPSSLVLLMLAVACAGAVTARRRLRS
jgi:hypothetical protein